MAVSGASGTPRDQINVRVALAEDEEQLWRFLAIAAYEVDAESAKRTEIVAAHLLGWPRSGDFGVLAECGGEPIGAAWARQFGMDEDPTYYAGSNIPEISIGVALERRSRGVGSGLLKHLEMMARTRGLGGLCLNVRDSNPAVSLYQRAGYRIVEGIAVENRTGGRSLAMVLSFAK